MPDIPNRENIEHGLAELIVWKGQLERELAATEHMPDDLSTRKEVIRTRRLIADLDHLIDRMIVLLWGER